MTSPTEQQLMDAADKIAAVFNEVQAQGLHVTLDEDGDHMVTIWSADREDFSEVSQGNAGWETVG